MLEDKGIAVYVEQTEEAVRLYNELGKNERVGGAHPFDLLTGYSRQGLWGKNSGR